jgi:hypothetical protein
MKFFIAYFPRKPGVLYIDSFVAGTRIGNHLLFASTEGIGIEPIGDNDDEEDDDDDDDDDDEDDEDDR